MKTIAKTHPPRQAAGIALVIVISMIALLTAVTVSLMVIVDHSAQRSASEVAARQTEALAQTAFETLLADLGDEMERHRPNSRSTVWRMGRSIENTICSPRSARRWW